jgi:signal transduction histidine kinase
VRAEPPVVVALRDVIRDAVAEVADRAAQRGITIAVHDKGATTHGYPRDLARLVRNLLDNAVRFAQRGGRVEVVTETRDGATELTVADDGPGVAPADRERLFDPFYRPPGQFDDGASGAGLGLAIAKEILQAHGGELSLDCSTPGPRMHRTSDVTRARHRRLPESDLCPARA